jgi:hypothetical protein
VLGAAASHGAELLWVPHLRARSAFLAAKQGENGVFIKCDNWNPRDAAGSRICDASIGHKTVFD